MGRITKENKSKIYWLMLYGINIKESHKTNKKITWINRMLDYTLKQGYFLCFDFVDVSLKNSTRRNRKKYNKQQGLFRYYVNQLKEYLEEPVRDVMGIYKVKINEIPYFYLDADKLTNNERIVFCAIEKITFKNRYATTKGIIDFLNSYESSYTKTNTKTNTLHRQHIQKKPKTTKSNIQKIISNLKKRGYLDDYKGKNGIYTVKNSPSSEFYRQIIQKTTSKKNPIPRSFIKSEDLEESADKLDFIPSLFTESIPALHNISFKISMTSNVDKKGVKDILKLRSFPANLREENRIAHITQYQRSTVIMIGSSKNPYKLNIEGIKELTNALWQIQEHLTQLRQKNNDSPTLSYLAWELTNSHYNMDVGREGGEINFHLTWYDIQKRLWRIYDKNETDTFRLECNIKGNGRTFGALKDELEGVLQKEPTYKILSKSV